LFEEGSEVPLAVGSNEGTRADANGFTVGAAFADTVVHARIVISVTNQRLVAVFSGPISGAITNETSSHDVHAVTSVLAGLSTIAKVRVQRILTKSTKIVSGTETVDHIVFNIASTFVHARIISSRAHGRLVAPSSHPSRGTHATVRTGDGVVVTHTTVLAISCIAAVQHEFREGILAIITEVTSRTVALDGAVDDIAHSAVCARVGVAHVGLITPRATPALCADASVDVGHGVVVTDTSVLARSVAAIVF